MSMRQCESVSASLIQRQDLPDTGLVLVTAVIAGETESIIVDCGAPELRAWRNVCPHEGRRLDYAPGKFLIDKQNLVCAAHGASFRLTDGFCVSGPCRGESLQPIHVEQLPSGELRFGSARD
jgi:nitrite reductase/ring-hydroxylating ferredoxin subunit